MTKSFDTTIVFTGSRRGATEAQMASVKVVLAGTVGTVDLFNGFAEGFDEQVLEHVDIIGDRLSTLSLYPCSADREKAAHAWKEAHHALEPKVWIAKPHPPLVRNRHMVECALSRHLRAADWLRKNRPSFVLAAPHGPEEVRSGTWSTVRYARKLGVPVTIVRPDGVIRLDGRYTDGG